MKDIHLVDFHHVDEFLDFVHGVEMPCDIEQHTSIAKTRGVLNDAAWDFPAGSFRRFRIKYLERHKLLESLDSIYESVQTSCPDCYLSWGDID